MSICSLSALYHKKPLYTSVTQSLPYYTIFAHFQYHIYTSSMKLLLTALGITIVLGLHSCSEDFTVSAPYRQISVVAGILDRADTAHYIRIQKAFMDENKSAINMSKEPDSSFYSNLTVKLYQYDSAQTKVMDSVALYRVDMNNEGDVYKKLDPINDQQFFSSPNYAYKFTNAGWTKPHVLSPRHWYKMVITNNKDYFSDTSDYVGIVNSDSNRVFDGFYLPDFAQAQLTISFARTTQTSRYRLFAFMPRNGRVAEGYIRFHYVEKNIATNTSSRKQVDYAFDREEAVTKGGVSFELTTLNSNIYGFLVSSIGPAPDNVERYLDSCDIYMYAAGPELFYYNSINQGQTGGLTGDNIQPNYTNFKSNNVIGVLGSRGMRIYRNAAIEKATIDSLMINPSTVPLRIRGVSAD